MSGRKKTKTLRTVLLFLLGIVGLFLLGYGYVIMASLIGRETIMVENTKRTYRIFVPSTYREEEAVPLVLVLHMLTGSGKTTEWLTHFNEIAESEGFIVVYPEGYKGSWAEGSGLYTADQSKIDDVVFITRLIDTLRDEYHINPEQIFVTGFSSGGFMAQRLGCEMSHRIAAFATVGATLSRNFIDDCDPERALPVLMINGTEDHGVPWNGDADYLSVPDTLNFWIKQNECDSKAEKIQLTNSADDGTHVERDVYSNCLNNTRVELYSIIGGGHTWPSGSQVVQLWGLNGKISQDMDASRTIWDFFKNQINP